MSKHKERTLPSESRTKRGAHCKDCGEWFQWTQRTTVNRSYLRCAVCAEKRWRRESMKKQCTCHEPGMGHHFGSGLRCDYCNVGYMEHQRDPRKCLKRPMPVDNRIHDYEDDYEEPWPGHDAGGRH